MAKNLHEDDVKSYKCDNSTQRMLIDVIQPLEDSRHVEISQSCYAIYIMVLPRAHLASRGIVMYMSVMDCSAARTRAVESVDQYM